MKMKSSTVFLIVDIQVLKIQKTSCTSSPNQGSFTPPLHKNDLSIKLTPSKMAIFKYDHTPKQTNKKNC